MRSVGREKQMRRRAMVLIPLFVVVLIALFFALRPNSPSEESSTEGSSTEGPLEETVDLMITGGNSMTPDQISVTEGEHVTLTISSDEPLEFHLHGYDLETEVEPNEPAELSFDATISGRFEIENEGIREELGALLVQPG